ncbi:MAG: sugar phosphate nucleotidyltransferase [Bacteroidota bacterium]
MKIIVPMAGMGKRMRPHTLTVAKPLIPIAGKPIGQRLVEDIVKVCQDKVDEIAYIIHPAFGKATEDNLVKVAESLGAKGTIHYQEEPLGTAHAILCAKSALEGNVVVAFADTLFRADFKLDSSAEGIIWVKQIEDPRQFGVIKMNDNGDITAFVEKPEEFVSDLAIIGIYYFKDGANLRGELQYLLDNNIMEKGEYQLTNALENMQKKGLVFRPGTVTDWLDCGNKAITVQTNQRYLDFIKNDKLVADTVKQTNSVIIAPSYIGENVVLENAVVGPHASIGANTTITNAVISNSIVQTGSQIANAVISGSMIGNHAVVKGKALDLSLGDYTVME